MKRIGLLPRIIIAIALGIALGQVMPMGGVRLFATFNTIFAQYLGFLIPLIIVGVVAVMLLTGKTFNFVAIVGTLGLIGMLIKNGIVLMDEITLQLGRGVAPIKALIDSAQSRLRPVMMASLTTILGMVPMAVGTGQGAELWRPMGTAVIGGLTVSTILTLLFVPVLYCVFASTGIRRQRRKHHKALENAKAK